MTLLPSDHSHKLMGAIKDLQGLFEVLYQYSLEQGQQQHVLLSAIATQLNPSTALIPPPAPPLPLGNPSASELAKTQADLQAARKKIITLQQQLATAQTQIIVLQQQLRETHSIRPETKPSQSQADLPTPSPSKARLTPDPSSTLELAQGVIKLIVRYKQTSDPHHPNARTFEACREGDFYYLAYPDSENGNDIYRVVPHPEKYWTPAIIERQGLELLYQVDTVADASRKKGQIVDISEPARMRKEHNGSWTLLTTGRVELAKYMMQQER